MINLSFSASQKYITSPMSYFLHYVLRLRPLSQGSALVFGSALDVAFNSLLNSIKDKQEPSIVLAKELFRIIFTGDGQVDNRIIGSLKFSKADLDLSLIKDLVIPKNHDPAWYSLSLKGELMIEAYYEQFIPKIEKVLAVQHEIQLSNENGDILTGIVDFIAQINGKIYLCDNKSTSITYKDNSANESAQLATYYEALKEEFALDGVAYITISKKLYKKKKPQIAINIIFGSITEALLNQTFEKYDEVLEGIKAKKFDCSRNERNGCCSAPWGCSYRTYCESNGKDLTGLVFHAERKTKN